jgi:hypothetical protein
MKSYEQFLVDLAVRESGGKYEVVNEGGYLGKYQMGKAALIDAKYYRRDGKKGNNFADSYWTGKDGVKSKSGFLKSHQAQENAIREYMKVQWSYLVQDGVDRFVGQIRYGLFVTISGALAGAHLVGWSNVGPFVKKGSIAEDGTRSHDEIDLIIGQMECAIEFKAKENISLADAKVFDRLFQEQQPNKNMRHK